RQPAGKDSQPASDREGLSARRDGRPLGAPRRVAERENYSLRVNASGFRVKRASRVPWPPVPEPYPSSETGRSSARHETIARFADVRDRAIVASQPPARSLIDRVQASSRAGRNERYPVPSGRGPSCSGLRTMFLLAPGGSGFVWPRAPAEHSRAVRLPRFPWTAPPILPPRAGCTNTLK